MFGIKDYLNSWAHNRVARNRAFNIDTSNPLSNMQWYADKPAWIKLSEPCDFERAVRYNPVVKATINQLAEATSNGKKVAVDTNSGEIIPWTENDKAIQKAYKLLVQRPNPLQSAKEFEYQGIYYLKTFGNRYVYANMPTGFTNNLDLMMIETLVNLPSQYVEVKTTGKLIDQTDIKGIISEYAITNTNPVTKKEPSEILHFNEVNITSEMPTIMGVSKLEALKYPITNTQLAFEAMNTILRSRGMQGIISPRKTDGQGSMSLSPEEKTEIDEKFKANYGLLEDQNPFLLTPVPLDYIRTVMNSSELGIYEEFSNNAILIGNEFGVPPELIKTYIKNATYENQVQSVRRLYQDTVIPQTKDTDSYWSQMLDTFKYGFEIKTTWEHIPALADSFKEKAQSINLKGKTAKEAYDENVITWNQYLEMLELPIVDGGDVLKSERKLGNDDDNDNNTITEGED